MCWNFHSVSCDCYSGFKIGSGYDTVLDKCSPSQTTQISLSDTGVNISSSSARLCLYNNCIQISGSSINFKALPSKTSETCAVYIDSNGKLSTGLVSGSASVSGEKVSKCITLASHGFAVKDVIGWSGGTYNKAIADGTYNGEFLGIVSKCINANTFELTQAGYVTGFTGLVTNSTHFLSDTTYGLLTTVEPTGNTHISKSVLIADSTTSGWVLPYPGYVISTGTTTTGTVNCCSLTISGNSSATGFNYSII
jgi:hypothetical protein